MMQMLPQMCSKRGSPCTSVTLTETLKLMTKVITLIIWRKVIYTRVAMAERNALKPNVSVPRLMFPTTVAITNNFSCLFTTNHVGPDVKEDSVHVWGFTQIIDILLYCDLILQRKKKKEVATELFNLAWPAVRCQGSLVIGQRVCDMFCLHKSPLINTRFSLTVVLLSSSLLWSHRSVWSEPLQDCSVQIRR